MPFSHFRYSARATFTRNFDSHSSRVHSRHVVCRLRARTRLKPFRASFKMFHLTFEPEQWPSDYISNNYSGADFSFDGAYFWLSFLSFDAFFFN